MTKMIEVEKSIDTPFDTARWHVREAALYLIDRARLVDGVTELFSGRWACGRARPAGLVVWRIPMESYKAPTFYLPNDLSSSVHACSGCIRALAR